MSDYIKREDAIGIVKNLKRFSCFGDDGFVQIPMVYCELMKVASADVAPVRHGHWIFNQEEMSLHCSYCDEVFRFEDAEKDECLDFMEYAKYCLACGTRMDGDSDE